ncbi:type I secretion system permease/ATPase [Inhella sp. 1Y17]|uniref:Type I secretion system permease/ATPase n=1 Tax=Inhella proteolytica TaxID=2795029 RepID=A0A931J729_9BURK|nr:type I secretion system permease/ATPase [Inhella proteolytica]
MSLPQKSSAPPSEAPVKDALREQRPYFAQAARLSAVIGVFALAPSWFMFEVYGRVMDSRSYATLGWLLLAVAGVYVIMELLEVARSRALFAAAERFDAQLRERAFNATFDANLRRMPGGTPQVLADLRAIKDFIPSLVVTALMDLPAAVLCLVLLFAMSPWLGVLAVVGMLLQALLGWVTERRTMPLLSEATTASIEAQNYAAGAMRGAQVIESMGMLRAVHGRFMERQKRFITRQAAASDTAGLTSMAAKLVQTIQGSLLLGAACYLTLHNGIWGGASMMIIASILGGRALGPSVQLVSNWRAVVNVRDAYKRLNSLLVKLPPTEPGMPLPAPKGVLTVEQVVAAPPGSAVPVLKGVSLVAVPGEVTMIIGPSASGKTTLARLIMGLWPASAGKVRLDGADVHAWHKSQLGPYLGYLPQGVELFDGTVAENIARFGKVDMEEVRAVSDRVGITAMIEALPEGFDTRIGEEGAVLSGGQRQRLGLARALYGNPKLVVLDEPNASLDEAGEKSLLALLMNLKQQGTTVLAITHRTTLLPAADKLLVLNEGQAAMFGPRDEVLAALKKANEQARGQAAQQAQQRMQAAQPAAITGSPA